MAARQSARARRCRPTPISAMPKLHPCFSSFVAWGGCRACQCRGRRATGQFSILPGDRAAMKKILIAFTILLFPSLPLPGQELPLKVEGAWMQAVPDSSEATAVYLTLINLGKTPLELAGARTT